jgi:hypothetical protein
MYNDRFTVHGSRLKKDDRFRVGRFKGSGGKIRVWGSGNKKQIRMTDILKKINSTVKSIQ